MVAPNKQKITNQRFLVVTWKSSHRTCYRSHLNMVNSYWISGSQMTMCDVCSYWRSHNLLLFRVHNVASDIIVFLIWIARCVSLVEQAWLTFWTTRLHTYSLIGYTFLNRLFSVFLLLTTALPVLQLTIFCFFQIFVSNLTHCKVVSQPTNNTNYYH